MEDDFGPRTDQDVDTETTDNPLASHGRGTSADTYGYLVSGMLLPRGSTAVAWRASAAMADRVTDYPDRLTQHPELADGAASGTIWMADEDSQGWIRTFENGLWLPKRYLVPVDHQGDPLTEIQDKVQREAPVRPFTFKRRAGKTRAEMPVSASTTSEPLAPSTSALGELDAHDMAARAQAQRAPAIVIEGLERILPASRAPFRPMGLANGRPRWCQPDDDEVFRTFDQSLDVSPAEHKLFEGSLGLQMYYFPPNGKWFVATHFEPRRDSAFAWVQADGAIPLGTSIWKVQGPYDGEKWSPISVRVRELSTEEEVKRHKAAAYVDELVDCAKRADAIQAQAQKVRQCGFMFSGHPQKSFNGLYRPRNVDTQRSMRWPALESAASLLKQTIAAQYQLESNARDSREPICVDSTHLTVESRDEEVADLRVRCLRALQCIVASDRCSPSLAYALEVQMQWLSCLCGLDTTTSKEITDATGYAELPGQASALQSAVPCEPEPALEPAPDNSPMQQGVEYFDEDQVVGMAENEQLAAAIAISLQQVTEGTEELQMPHLLGNWPYYVNDEEKHLYYYYPWGRWFINSEFTPTQRRRGGEIKTNGVLPEEPGGCVWKVWLGKQWSKATVCITAMHSPGELEAHKRRQAAQIGRQAMEVEWLQVTGLSGGLSAMDIIMKQVGDANGFPCWKSTNKSLFLFFFRGEWIINHECIRENLGQPYFPPRRPLACEAFLPTLDCCPVGTNLWMVQSRKKWIAQSLSIHSLVNEPLLEARQRVAFGKLLHHRTVDDMTLNDIDVIQRVGMLCSRAQAERRQLRRLEEYRGRQDQRMSPGTVLRVGDAEAEYIAWRRKRGGPNVHNLHHLTGSMMGETISVKLSTVSWYVLRPPLGQQQDSSNEACLQAQGSDGAQWYEAIRTVVLTCSLEPASEEIGTVQKGDFIMVRERQVVAGVSRLRCAFGWASSVDLRLFAPLTDADRHNLQTRARGMEVDGKPQATALFAWDEQAGASTNDLTFQQGDHIVIESEDPGQGWMTGSADGRVGIFPTSYVDIHNTSILAEEAPADILLNQPDDKSFPRLEIIMARLEEQLYVRAPIILSKMDCRNLLNQSGRRVDWALIALELRLQYRHAEWDCCQAVSYCCGDKQKAAGMLREWHLLSLLAANTVLGSACAVTLMLIGYADEETELMWSCVFAKLAALIAIDFYFFLFEHHACLGTQPPRQARRALSRAQIDRPGLHRHHVSVPSKCVASLFAPDDEDDEDDEDEKALPEFLADTHADSEKMVSMEIVVAESSIELHCGDEMVCHVEMRWLNDDTSLRLDSEDPHRITMHPEFCELSGSRIRHGKRVDIRTVQASAKLYDLIRRRQEPVQIPKSAELSRHHCEWLRPLILRWVPGYACLLIYIALTATEYGPYFVGGPSAILLLFLLGVARTPFLGMYPDRAVLINVLRGEFDISMGYAHSMGPSRYLWFGSPAALLLVFCILIRFTMMVVPSTELCRDDTRSISAGAENGSAATYGGISSRHIAFDWPEIESRDDGNGKDAGEPSAVDDYTGGDIHGVYAFDSHTLQQIRTTPPDRSTCSGSTPAWMDTLQISGPCLRDDGTASCDLPSAWEGPVSRNICLQTSMQDPCGAVLPALVQRCTHGRYRYKLPTPEATVINPDELALSRGDANLTWNNNVKVGMPQITSGVVSGDIHVEYLSSTWINRPDDTEASRDSAGVDANVVKADPKQMLFMQMHGTQFVAPAQSCATAANSTQEYVQSWTQAQNKQCELLHQIGQVPNTFSSAIAAKAACEQRADCRAISGPGSCDGPGPWTLCRKGDGQHSARASCMHVRETPHLAACIRMPFTANESQLTAERTVACAPRTVGSAYVMYTEEPVSTRFRTAEAVKLTSGTTSMVSSDLVPRGSHPIERYSEHFVCVAFEESIGWVYDSIAPADTPNMLNISSTTFVPATSDILVARIEYGRTYRASYCLEDTPDARVRRNSTGAVVVYDQWSDPLVIYPIVWFVLAVLLICDDPFYWGCNLCRSTGPHGLWCV